MIFGVKYRAPDLCWVNAILSRFKLFESKKRVYSYTTSLKILIEALRERFFYWSFQLSNTAVTFTYFHSGLYL